MKTAPILLVFASLAAAAAVQVGYVNPSLPVASGYIYRSDNNGPASLIQLGAVPYQQPQVFAQPLPLAQPIKLEALEAYDLAPVPLPYIAAKPIVIEDAEDDDDEDDDHDDDDDDDEDSDELSDEHVSHDHAAEQGGGNDYEQKHHAAQGEKGSKGYKSNEHHAKGESGNYGKAHKEGFYVEGGGDKASHHDEADAHGKHYEAGKSYKGGNHGHKKHFSKGEDVTGYHKVFHKDEFKKDHDFYDVADNSGHFKKHGYEKAHQGSKKGAHKEGGHHDSGHHKGEFGNSGAHAKGHHDESEAGHSANQGHESYHKHHEDFGKKGASGHQKEYAYDDDE